VAVEPVDTNIVVAVLAGAGLPVTAMTTPLVPNKGLIITNEPVFGLIKVATLALFIVTEAVVPTLLNISELEAAVKVPLATLATNNVSPPLLK
jgi:hypothetical protein